MFTLLLLPVVVATASDVFYNVRDGQRYFEDFVEGYHKVYKTDEEKALRYEIFMKNLDGINDLNRRNGLSNFGINQFSDLTPDEFLSQYAGCKYDYSTEKYTRSRQNRNEEVVLPSSLSKDEIPKKFDWRTKNVVSRVKGQGGCGSCWAFSAIGTVESEYAIKTGKLLDLSVQQLVDCDKSSLGCGGGYPDKALSYVISAGAMSEKSYPYEAKDGVCRYDNRNIVVKVSNFSMILPPEENFVGELYQKGPLSIVLDATNLQSYTGGILSGNDCSYTSLNHAVLLVGYGVENDVPYWLVKNSWDVTWGESGYFKMQRGVNCLNFAHVAPIRAMIL